MNKNLIRWAKEKLPIVIADNSTEDLQQITSARQWSIHAGVGTHVVSNQILIIADLNLSFNLPGLIIFFKI